MMPYLHSILLLFLIWMQYNFLQMCLLHLLILDGRLPWIMRCGPLFRIIPGTSVICLKGRCWLQVGIEHPAPDGTVDRLQARLVAKGFTQVSDMDYSYTFSPVAKITSGRLLISLAATYSGPFYQMDVQNAFLLNGNPEEEVYMEQPPGWVWCLGGVWKSMQITTLLIWL